MCGVGTFLHSSVLPPLSVLHSSVADASQLIKPSVYVSVAFPCLLLYMCIHVCQRQCNGGRTCHYTHAQSCRLPRIIGHASAEDVPYRKWVWPSIDSVDPSHCAFQGWCFSHVCFWSYSLSEVKFGHSYARQILRIIGRRSVLLLWGNSRRVFGNIGKPHDPAATHPILIVVAALSTERCRWMSRHLYLDGGFLHIFSVDTSNRLLGLWCRIQWNVQVLRSTMVKVRCLCILWFSRYMYSHFLNIFH